MVDPVSFLNTPQKTTLYERQRLERVQNLAQTALATGRKVSRVSDNPVDFYRAQGISQRVNDIYQVKANIDLGVESLNTAQVGLTAIENLSHQLQGVAYAARGADPSQRAEFSQQFNTIRQQIDAISKDTAFQGGNLLNSSADSLSIQVGNISQGAVTVKGNDSSGAGLGVGTASSYNDFASNSDIQAALNDVSSAIQSVRTQQSSYGNSLALINIRDEANSNLAKTFQAGVDKLINANANEEAARSLAATVRQDLSLQSQRLRNMKYGNLDLA